MTEDTWFTCPLVILFYFFQKKKLFILFSFAYKTILCRFFLENYLPASFIHYPNLISISIFLIKPTQILG